MTRLPLLLPLLLLLNACRTLHDPEVPPPEKPISVETLLKTTESWDGEPLPPYAEGRPEVTILRITIAPGAALPDHNHPYMNAGVLLSGRLTVKTETGKTLRLEAGDALSEVVGTWHYGSNPGDEPAVILVTYAGIEGRPVTVLRNEHGHAH